MRINSIESPKNNRNRFKLVFDDRRSIYVDSEILLAFHLKSDQQLTEEEFNKIVAQKDWSYWYNRTLNYLSFRPRSKKEIEAFLEKNKVPLSIQQKIIQKLEKYAFINDEVFARWFVDNQAKPKGKRRLEQELKLKGINKAIIEEVLKGQSIEDELQAAERLLSKKMSQWNHLPKEKRYQRMVSLLSRRGYDWSLINKLIKEKLGLRSEVDSDD